MMELSSEHHHHHQEMATDSLENMLICTKAQQERKPRPQQEQPLKCPRCDSTNTKFCYYNNYSLTQPRYFCKSCRRYWTNGGTLRNIPVGGGCRKNKRSTSLASKRSMTSSNSDHHQLQSQPYHHMLLNSSSDQYHTRQQMSSYDNDNDQYHHQPACSDHLSLVLARLQKQQASVGGGGYHDHQHHDHSHQGHEHNNNHNHNNDDTNLLLLGNYSKSHFGNLMGLNNTAGGGGHHGFLEGIKANPVLEQTHQFQNNSTNFQNLYNGGFGSNGSTSCSMSNISGDQMMTIIPACEDYLGINSSFGTSRTAGTTLLLKQEDDYSNNTHNLMNEYHNNNPRSSQILWEGAAAAAAGFPWHQINANSSINGNNIIVDHLGNSDYNMVDNADLAAVRENMNVFAAGPIWQGLINSPLM